LTLFLLLFAYQIRSHAQKYFIKDQRHGTGEKIPPPRPKKRSTSGGNRDPVPPPPKALLADPLQYYAAVKSEGAHSDDARSLAAYPLDHTSPNDFMSWMAANGFAIGLSPDPNVPFDVSKAFDYQRQQRQQLEDAQTLVRQQAHLATELPPVIDGMSMREGDR
jgi:hypothetical protein